MTVKEFVDGYTQLGSEQLRNKYVKELLKRDYVPYLEKMQYAKNAVNAVYLSDINGKKIFQYNSNISFLLYIRSIITMYYNIEFEKDENNINEISQYDLLFKNSLVSVLMSNIPEEELKTYEIVFGNERNDVIDNNTDLSIKISEMDNVVSEMLNRISSEIE